MRSNSRKLKTLISVIGPTASGKTKLAIEIARFFKTEILSCDARQFFKEIPIGTAMPSTEELSLAPHHFIANRSITEDYSIGQFENDALQLLNQLFQKYDYVVMVGGSGMYEKAVTVGLDELPKANESNIAELADILQNQGIGALQKLLKNEDPEYYQTVDLENPRRLIRALDVYQQTGMPFSSFLNRPKAKRNFKTIHVGIEMNREILYNRINRRVDQMMKDGLLEEVKKVYPYRNKKALQTVGYKELFKYLDGEWSLDFAVSEIKKNTRRYAKRQLTWFRKYEDTQMIPWDYNFKDLQIFLQNLT